MSRRDPWWVPAALCGILVGACIVAAIYWVLRWLVSR